MTWLRVVSALSFGLVFGSFLTVAIHRVPKGESVVTPRSRCPSCGVPLRIRDNLPVVSWMFLRGRCHSCGTRISAVYPLTELAVGVLFVAAALEFHRVWVAVMMGPFLGLLAALAVIDFRHQIIPNRIVYPSLVVFPGYLLVAGVADGGVDLARAGIGFLAYGGGLLLVAIAAPRGMGMGDVKLAALIGLVLGSLGLAYVGVAAALGILLGGVGAIVALLLSAGRKEKLPFGPFLAAGGILAAFVGLQIADAYLRLLR